MGENMGKAFAQRWQEHTFKREFALIAFVVWTALTYKVFWHNDVAFVNALGSAYGTASTSIWLFILSAFGMDFAAKQWSERAPAATATYATTATYGGATPPKLSPGGALIPK